MPCTHWDSLASLCPGPVGSPKSPSLYQIKYFRILFHKASPSPAIGLLRPRRISLSYTSQTLPTFQASPPHCRHLSQGTVCSREGKTSKQKNPFDHFIRVQPTVFPYAEIRTGNTDVTSVSLLPTLPFERTGTLHPS